MQTQSILLNPKAQHPGHRFVGARSVPHQQTDKPKPTTESSKLVENASTIVELAYWRLQCARSSDRGMRAGPPGARLRFL